jgi:hypothetical protein
MKTIALGKVLRTAVDPLRSSVPNRLRCQPKPSHHPSPIAKLQRKMALPSGTLTGKFLGIATPFRFPSIQSSNRTRARSTQNCAAAHFIATPYTGDTNPLSTHLAAFFSAIAPHQFLFR